MTVTIQAPSSDLLKILAVVFALALISGCSTPAQQRAEAEIQAVNAQEPDVDWAQC